MMAQDEVIGAAVMCLMLWLYLRGAIGAAILTVGAGVVSAKLILGILCRRRRMGCQRRCSRPGA